MKRPHYQLLADASYPVIHGTSYPMQFDFRPGNFEAIKYNAQAAFYWACIKFIRF